MTSSLLPVRPARRSGALHSARLLPAAPETIPIASVQGALALDLTGSAPPRRREGVDWQLIRGRRAELDAFAQRFCAAVVEVVGGDRGPRQLLRWTTERVYQDLVERCEALARTTPGDCRLRRIRAQVRSVHLSCPSPAAAELSMHVRHGERSRAIAARLELHRDRWICVALEFG